MVETDVNALILINNNRSEIELIYGLLKCNCGLLISYSLFSCAWTPSNITWMELQGPYEPRLRTTEIVEYPHSITKIILLILYDYYVPL